MKTCITMHPSTSRSFYTKSYTEKATIAKLITNYQLIRKK